MIDVENRLGEILKNRGMTQKFIVDKTGINKGTISEIVRGNRVPTLIVALKIADVLGVSVEEIWSLRK